MLIAHREARGHCTLRSSLRRAVEVVHSLLVPAQLHRELEGLGGLPGRGAVQREEFDVLRTPVSRQQYQRRDGGVVVAAVVVADENLVRGEPARIRGVVSEVRHLIAGAIHASQPLPALSVTGRPQVLAPFAIVDRRSAVIDVCVLQSHHDVGVADLGDGHQLPAARQIPVVGI